MKGFQLKFLLKTVIGIVAVCLVFLLIGMLLPGFYRSESTIYIGAPSNIVYHQVSDFAQWQKWSPWAKSNVGSTVKMSHPSGGVDAWCEWKNKSLGDILTTFTYQENGTSIYYRILYNDHGLVGIGSFKATPEGSSGTRVSWSVAEKIGLSPIKRWTALWMASSTGADLDAGLKELKRITEKKVAASHDFTGSNERLKNDDHRQIDGNKLIVTKR